MYNKDKINGCIHILSGRVKCLKLSLESFYEYYNNKYDYPIYVYYFDPLFTENYIEDIHKTISPKIEFIELEYLLPKHIKKSELFCFRDNEYVENHFGTKRIGYLHMIHYFVNFYNYKRTKFKEYDFTMSFDDESLFLKHIEFDIFSKLKDNSTMMGSLNASKRNLPASQRTLDTREFQFEFVKYYINKYKIYQDTDEFNSLLDPNLFHGYTVTDTNVFDLSIFKTKEFKQWVNEVNKFAGVYKHRWGDHELNGLFWVIHFDKPFFNYDFVKKGILDPGGLRHIQNYTPGVKNLWN